MRIETIELKNKTNIMSHYRKNDSQIMRFFDYHPFNDYKSRLEYIQQRTYNREELVQALRIMNDQWGAPKSTQINIEKLRSENAVTVIGGQQAGLLTGPLYTINKMISIIKHAKQQEEKLNVPVVPVFWIAGEDHDYDEINHIHLLSRSEPELKKHSLPTYIQKKIPISNIKLNEVGVQEWVDNIFRQLQETDVTKDLYQSIYNSYHRSETLVDFFARILFTLFSDDGIVLVDSNDRQIRQIESDYFIKLIEHQKEVTSNLYLSAQKVKQAGYSLSLDLEADDAHLFYHYQDERILLKRMEDGQWAGKQNEVKLTTEELLQIAQETPHLLSNNVVTRPLMQEMLFPTLAFIGGWGEISYWAVLKQAFDTLDMKVPPVVPRLSLSYIDQQTAKIMSEYKIKAEQAINNGVKQERVNWLASKHDRPIGMLAEQIKNEIKMIHQPLRSIARDIRPDIGEMSDKNIYYLQKEVDFLVNKMTKAINEQYDQEISDFSMLEKNLHPYGGLQERILNPVQFINVTNQHFIKTLIQSHLPFNQDHFAIYL